MSECSVNPFLWLTGEVQLMCIFFKCDLNVYNFLYLSFAASYFIGKIIINYYRPFVVTFTAVLKAVQT